jgi:Na+/H+ antiporter NhaD/arsenite permease-like protein
MMIEFIKKEAVLCAAALLAVISMFFVPPDTAYIGYINFRVLCLLFSLMTVVAGLRGLKVFDIIARRLAAKCGNMRSLVTVLVAVCFFSSMLITNDVALLTFVPLAIGVLTISGGKEYIIYTVILQTVAANMGSMLTPMGNPQNLYLSDFYSMSTAEFFSATLPVCIASAVLILLMLLFVKKRSVAVADSSDNISVNKKLLAVYIILGILALMAVFNVTEHFYICVTVITLVAVLACDRAVLKRVDWFLLLTFVMFFVFVGNAARIEPIRELLSTLTKGREVLVGALSSQLISNVPAAVMLSTFTDNGRALLVGVDIGGLGTPVASLASLISYRLYAASEDSNKGRYMLMFLGINFALLAVLLMINVLL